MTSVFGRLTGRRHPSQQQQQSGGGGGVYEKGAGQGNATQPSLALDVHQQQHQQQQQQQQQPTDERGRSEIKATNKRLPNGHHRRESSILSLTNSVTDLGSTVRRSVSLRSHRTTFSGSGGSISSTFARDKNRSPSSGTNLTLFSPLSASPIESGDELPAPLLPPGPPPPIPTSTPTYSGRHSVKKSLSQKFKHNASTDTLKTTLITAPLPTRGDPSVRTPIPRTATDQPRPHLPTMLATSTPIPPSPALTKRPTLATQQSFSNGSRDTYSSHGGAANNGAHVRDTLSAAALAGNHNPKAVYQQIHETAAKRMATMEYLRRVHEGDVFYFGTLHYSPTALAAMPSLSPHRLGRRATNYFVLGYSLPAALDMNAASSMEYLKALSALLSEFESYQNLSGFDSSGSTISRGRMGQMLKSGMSLGNRSARGRRSSTVTDTASLDSRQSDSLGITRSAGGGASSADAGSPLDTAPSPIGLSSGHDFSLLLTPHLPFEPDFCTTFAALCDALIGTYAKLMELVAGPEACGPGVGEAFAKADKAIRKILVANVAREFEETTRAGVKVEVAGLGKLVLGGLM